VKGILDLMGGNIWYTTEVNVGTTFYFTLPFNSTVKKNKFLISKSKIEIGDWSNSTVLIVEDDLPNNELLNDSLIETKLKLLNAKNGKETLAFIESNLEIDLILMDIRLLDTNGLELTRKIKKIKPEIKIIAQTAYAGSQDINDCRMAGCDDFISKPVKTEQLIQMMGQYLNK
jgi:CheY-like chemotaxis protein